MSFLQVLLILPTSASSLLPHHLPRNPNLSFFPLLPHSHSRHLMAPKKRKVDQEEQEQEVHEQGQEQEQLQYDVLEPQPQPLPSQSLVPFHKEQAGADDVDEEDEDIAKLLEPLSRDHLVSLLRSAAASNPATLAEIHRLADLDPSHRKIFIHGLNWNTTADVLHSFFSKHGEIEDCRVVTDRNTGKSKGYGFVLFRHRKSARKALMSPQNLIDGRMTACQLASVGPTGHQQGHMSQTGVQQQVQGSETASRKIFVGNVHPGIDGGRLLDFFSRFGEIEEGPLGFDRQTGKPKGFALFIYRTVEGAKKALEEPNKNFEGQNLYCQRASDGHKHKASAPSPQNSLADAGFGGNTGYNVQSSGGYGGLGSSGSYNGAVDMAMSQGMMGGGAMQFGQGMQQANAALAMLAAAGQNPAAFGVPPALIASFNPALAAAMTGGNPQMAMQNTMTPPGYGVANSGYQNVGYQGPSPSVNQGSNTYQGAPMGQAPVARPSMGPMGGYAPH